ncbi:hypothetical protein PR002_g19387 [Phytophthora rubi]|uniref:Uncharacterized protein n=1 Tax=Phytophthora rubi TaxID=129364 RepID=A0A6A3JWZ6_9STRA|nr:hypothetical protein PR002_g19387 [Phytophthora rubi]
MNVIDFRVGFTYRFEKVHSLRVGYGRSAGSVQIRQRLHAIPLPPLGSTAATAGPHDAAPEQNAEVLPSVGGSASQASGKNAAADCCDDTVLTSAVKIPPKRKARNCSGSQTKSLPPPR